MTEHLGGAYLDTMDGNTYMPDVWEYLVNKFNVKSMVDVGCGGGWNTAWFHGKGLYAVGIDGWDEALRKTQMPQERLIKHDYTMGPLTLDREFDLGWSSEFVEHVEEKFIPNWMETLKKCRHVCITFATPGQGGHHHVCEREEKFWLETFKRYGFSHDSKTTAWMRKTDVSKAPWGRKSLTMFHRL